MGRKIQFELNDDELAAYLATKEGMTHREAILKAMGIDTEVRAAGRKPLTKGESKRATQRVRKVYYEIIDELEEAEKDSTLFVDFMDEFRASGYPQEKAGEIELLLEAGRKALFTGLRKWVDGLTIVDVEDFGRQAVKTMLTPPKMPTVEEAYDAMTQHGRDLYKEHEKELAAHNTRLYKISKEEEPAAEPPVFDMDLRMKAMQMAGPNTGSVDNVYKRLLKEKKAAEG